MLLRQVYGQEVGLLHRNRRLPDRNSVAEKSNEGARGDTCSPNEAVMVIEGRTHT